MSKCNAKRFSENGDYTFGKVIPETLHAPIRQAVSLTNSTAREHSLTFCRIKDTKKIFVASQMAGGSDQTAIKPCDSTSDQMGDLHTHPTQDNNTVGITPSTSDIVSTLADSVRHDIPQISCITGPESKYISCYQPKENVMRDKNKVRDYENTLRQTEGKVTDVPEYIRNNVGHDFTHAWYSKSSFKRMVPSSDDVVKDAFMKSGKFLKKDDVPAPEKPAFCNLIENLNYPTRDRRISRACLKYLG
jgi:hypothetical protein